MCCQEIGTVSAGMHDKDVECITDHTGFRTFIALTSEEALCFKPFRFVIFKL